MLCRLKCSQRPRVLTRFQGIKNYFLKKECQMKKIIFSIILLFGFGVYGLENSNKVDLTTVNRIARETAKWFEYTTGKIDTEHLGQCSDYALKFILKYNDYVGENAARLVTTNNPIPSGTYRIGKKVDVSKLGFSGFPSGSSGFLDWAGQLYLYHPVFGAYQIFLEKKWIPKLHFGVDMLDVEQVHTWATIGNTSVDPSYFDLWPDQFPSPLGQDQ